MVRLERVIYIIGALEMLRSTLFNKLRIVSKFVGQAHAWLYDVNLIEPEVREYLKSIGINLRLISRISDIEKEGTKIKGVYLSTGELIEADAFVETTGSTGPMGNCLRYGNGCSMCILRCPTFGPRVSLSARAGVEDFQGERDGDELGAFSGSCKLAKETLSREIVEQLDRTGVVVLKIPPEDINLDKLKSKVCQQYALKEFAENIILLDTGHAKLMTTYYPIEKLRKIKGLEKAKYIDPYSGGIGNSIRYLAVSPRTDDMKVVGLDNLFVGGEKSGLFVGHTEAIATGTLAGYNAVRYTLGMPMLILPRSTAIGDIISYANYMVSTSQGRKNRYTFAGAEYFKRMKENNLYTIDKEEIKDRVKRLNLENIFNEQLV
ncbi:Glucose inhibited division protein A [Clostridium frigidicarnis]|uniref:Glucose inhibited division protein A n=2 Tax=Clostridium frigidicarnis TaxID=84698 RepID=A0A1I0V7Z8_9CLOT|nr:Glucose inhibited division protein A [Clostridium frigidicarnis]